MLASHCPNYHNHWISFSAVKPNTLLLDSSTIDPMVSKSVAEQAKSKGAIYMDAPVSGGRILAVFE